MATSSTRKVPRSPGIPGHLGTFLVHDGFLLSYPQPERQGVYRQAQKIDNKGMTTLIELHAQLRTTSQLQDAGISKNRLTSLVRQGEIVRIRPGIFMFRNDLQKVKPWQRPTIATLAYYTKAPQTVFTHESAAWGCPQIVDT